MNFKESNHKSITQAFEEFHRANPSVYEMFVTQALRAINHGKTKISFKAILNYVRWETSLTQQVFSDPNSDYRINDAYSSRYARLFVTQYPQHKNKVELRKLRSE